MTEVKTGVPVRSEVGKSGEGLASMRETRVKPASPRGGVQPPVGGAERQDHAMTERGLSDVRTALAEVTGQSLDRAQRITLEERAREIVLQNETPREADERLARVDRVNEYLEQHQFSVPEGYKVLYHMPLNGKEAVITHIILPEGATAEEYQQAMEKAGIKGTFRPDQKWSQALDEALKAMLEGIKNGVDEVKKQAGNSLQGKEEKAGIKQLTVTDGSGNTIVVEVGAGDTQAQIKQKMRVHGVEPGLDVQVTDESGRNVEV